MTPPGAASHGRGGRAVERIALAVALGAAFCAGALFSPWKGVPRLISAYVQDANQKALEAERAKALPEVDVAPPPPKFDPAKGIPPADPPRRDDPKRPEPRALEARAATIHADADAIEAECRLAAGGDWQKWQRQTESYRENLRSRIEALSGAASVLESRPGLPLRELSPRERLAHLYDALSLEAFRKARAVIAAARWLHAQGVDLIFVPLPPMTSIYLEQFPGPCPQDGLIAPHVRKALGELLNDDVEVIDSWRRFRGLREVDSEYLYNAADGRLAARGRRVLAKEIADRIERYAFGTRARYALPIVRSAPAGDSTTDQVDVNVTAQWHDRSPSQSQSVQGTHADLSEIRMQDGRVPPDDPSSPVIVVGDRPDPLFQSQLVKELNLLIHVPTIGTADLDPFAEFVRDPKLLEHCRVVVWMVDEEHMARLPALPAPVMKLLDSPASSP